MGSSFDEGRSIAYDNQANEGKDKELTVGERVERLIVIRDYTLGECEAIYISRRHGRMALSEHKETLTQTTPLAWMLVDP